MKKGYKLLIIACLIILGNFSTALFGTEYRTRALLTWDAVEKDWSTNIWEVASGSSWSNHTGAPSMNNNDKINVGFSEVSGHNVVKNGGLNVGNNITIEVFPGNSLRIKGDIDVKQSFVVIVHTGALFIVEGDINISANNDNQAGEITIDGTAEITGDLTGLGNIHGTGTLVVDGVIGGGISINPGDGDSVNVTGNTTTYCPPVNLTADVNFNVTYYSVILTWEYNTTVCAAIGFEVKRILDGNSTLDVVGMNKSILEFSWVDENGDLTETSNPIYEVRAMYANGVKSEAAIVSFENNPLPIDLLYFNAKAEGSVVNMEWATATEINNDFFTIERSTNGNNWDIIDYVQGAGNTNYTIGYNFTDANPVEGIAYYRLKQTDFDGKFEYFAPVAVNFNNEVKAGEIVTVDAQGQRLNVWVNNQDAAANLVVANIQGRILYHGNVPATDYAQQINIDISQNIAGEILIIRLNTSQSSDERKIMAR